MKNDEILLYTHMLARSMTLGNNPSSLLSSVVDLKIPPKRLVYLLEKFADNGVYEYGVNVMLGWMVKPSNDSQYYPYYKSIFMAIHC